MELRTKKLLTIVTEAVLEPEIIQELKQVGIGGFTIDDVRGRGRRGVRRAEWEQSRTIRFQIVDEWGTLENLITRLREDFADRYAMFMFVADVATVE